MPDVSRLGQLLSSNDHARTYCDGESTTLVMRGGTAIRLVGLCCYTSGTAAPLNHSHDHDTREELS